MKKFSDIEILDKICKVKFEKMQKLGYALGHKIPQIREVPLIKPSILQDLESNFATNQKPDSIESSHTLNRKIDSIKADFMESKTQDSKNFRESSTKDSIKADFTESSTKDSKNFTESKIQDSINFAKSQTKDSIKITESKTKDSIITAANNAQNPHSKPPFFIAEIKRASPTAGDISSIKSPLNLAKLYLQQGANAISVLCEEEHFKGSLSDLMEVKNALPNACVLRKDFIFYPQEIEISYLAGADMVLLIAAIFLNDLDNFKAILKEIEKYNMTALIEIHTLQEYEFISKINMKNVILGINSRDLKTFKINAMNAIKLRGYIPCDTPVIYESGIEGNYYAFIAGSSDFSGILCGSYLVKNLDSNMESSALQDLKNAFMQGGRSPFLSVIARKFATKQKPLVKICGINDLDFLKEAAKSADLLGFILTRKSLRCVDIKFLKKANEIMESLDSKNFLRVAVVTNECLNLGIECLESGLIECLQYHDYPLERLNGSTQIENLFAFYPSISTPFSTLKNVKLCDKFMLFDSSSGEGKRLKIESIYAFLQTNPAFKGNLWLAGGISTDNLSEILSLNPMLIDICSSLESAKGVKSIAKLRSFFASYNAYFRI